MRHMPPIFLFHTPLMLLGIVFWLLLFALLFGLLMRRFGPQGGPPPFGYRAGGPPPPFGYRPAGPPPSQAPFQSPFPQPSAMEILRQRYARGEIDAVTYDQMRERLGGPEQAGE